jgi:hypothetical protein
MENQIKSLFIYKECLLKDIETVNNLIKIAIEFARETSKQGYKIELLGDEDGKKNGLIKDASVIISNLLTIYNVFSKEDKKLKL